MAKLICKPSVHIKTTLEIDENEFLALYDLAGYGIDHFQDFLELFYNKLGKVYLEKHKHGLQRFFETIKESSNLVIGTINKAREAIGEQEIE